MSVSLVKIPIAAGNAVPGTRIRIDGIPVRILSSSPARPGAVVLVGLTVHGAEVHRVFPVGTVFAPVPAWVFRKANRT